MRYRYALLQRRAKVVQARGGGQEISIWYIGKEVATGLSGDDTLEQAIAYAQAEGWECVPEEIAADAALLKRPR
jgi:hypothetical protein